MERLLFLTIIFIFALFSVSVTAQSSPVTADAITEDDLVPGAVKALPDYEKIKDSAVHIANAAELKKVLGERQPLDLVSFVGGSEAATANYEAGKLLIVEYMSPAVSSEIDKQVRERLASVAPNPPVYYRRTGNYNVFLFDAKDESSANLLLDRVKYEKTVKWLGEDPFYYNRAERHFVQSSVQLFLSTILAIGLLLGLVTVLGISAGLIYFTIRKREREAMTAFSDAGGMIRLNLDNLTPDVAPDRLLKG